MSVTAKCLIEATYAASVDTVQYTAPVGIHTIIDKFTATNVDVSSRTIDVSIVPSGNSAGLANKVITAVSVAAGATLDSSILQNQILNPGDMISVFSSAAAALVIRASGREVSA